MNFPRKQIGFESFNTNRSLHTWNACRPGVVVKCVNCCLIVLHTDVHWILNARKTNIVLNLIHVVFCWFGHTWMATPT